MTGEECNFLHPVPCRKYMGIPERSWRAQCKGYHPELCKYSTATRECYNNRCFRIHLKGTRHKQTLPLTLVRSTSPQTTNQQQSMIATENLAYNCPPPLLTLPTQHATSSQPAPSPTHYHIPPPTQYLTTHQTTVPLYHNPHHSMLSLIQPAHPHSYSIPFSASNICIHTPNTLSFSLHCHPTSIPHPTPQYPGWVPANDTDGHNCE